MKLKYSKKQRKFSKHSQNSQAAGLKLRIGMYVVDSVGQVTKGLTVLGDSGE